jgi:hypothetical protein
MQFFNHTIGASPIDDDFLQDFVLLSASERQLLSREFDVEELRIAVAGMN